MFTRTIAFLGNEFSYSNADIRKVDAIARDMESISYKAMVHTYGRSIRSAQITSRLAEGNTFWELHAVMEVKPESWKFVKLQLSQNKDEDVGLGMGLYVNSDFDKPQKGFWQLWDKESKTAFYLMNDKWTAAAGSVPSHPAPPVQAEAPGFEPDDELPF